MGLFDNLPRINAQKFRLNMAKNMARSVAQKEVWPLLEAVGEIRFRVLIEQDQPFLARIPYQQMPEKWRGWLASAPQYSTFIEGVNETFVLTLLPDWLQVLVTRDQKSWAWFHKECEWLASHFQLEAPKFAPTR